MRILTCASYYGTGSSAVTDFFSEFGKVSSAGHYEFRFLHDPDGIRDLEYHIVENNNRHNTSNAIKRYLKYARYFGDSKIRQGYKEFMGTAFMQYTKEYIDHITELQSETSWHFDRMERSALFNLIDSLFQAVGYKFHVYGFTMLRLLHEQSYYTAIDEETFLKYTREYVRQIVQALNKEGSEFIMIDQFVPPTHVDRYLRYLDDARAVVTERDPRDVFLSEKKLWRDSTIPYKDVSEYCKWFELTRRHRKYEEYDKEKVFFLQFEDMIYHYEETAEKLMKFAGLDPEDHLYPRKKFNPDVSINNTNLKAVYPQYADEIRYIEEHLSEYLYDAEGQSRGTQQQSNPAQRRW